jgi:hypothetical protein
VNKRNLALTIGAFITCIAIIFSACKKLNDSTELGGGLIPAVDNINTFDTTITVEAYNDIFPLLNDSLRLGKGEEYFLGKINNDPVFGKTDARIFLELKPTSYPYSFPRKDSLQIDSIVLVLNYEETYGDSTIPQTLNVYELDQAGSTTNIFRFDSSYLVRKNDFTYNNLLSLPGQSFVPQNLKDSVKAFQDTSNNQLRIKLDNNFARRLLSYDSTGVSNNAYSSDSAFKTKFNGFALQSMSSGNAVMGFNLAGANTKLAIYYRQPKKTGTIDSTTVTYFSFTVYSAAANYVIRDYSGTQVQAAVGGTTPDPFVYIQNNPGTYATIKIPALSSLSNRVIHKAELIAEQVYTNITDSIFHAPQALYLDANDPSIGAGINYNYRSIPYDFTSGTSGFDLSTFGAYPVNAKDAAGNSISTWHFDVSRYVQHILTHTQSLYDLRLYAPLFAYNLYGIPPATGTYTSIAVLPSIVKGRVKLTGNTGVLDPNPHKMRLRVIYSKL